MNRSKQLFYFGVVIAVLLDLALFLFLSIAQMQYDDFYTEEKGNYGSWAGMSTFEKLTDFGFYAWLFIHLVLISLWLLKKIKILVKTNRNV
ncbi:MAG: hypothetical protein K1X82_07205 [Bacteroidia bacterium]|nr:hypothetical protein [Bacteroidia bacterium]